MGLDQAAFFGARLAMPTRAVPVPDLAPWFGPDDAALWTVRGLNANELAHVESAEQRLGGLKALAEALSDGTAAEISAGVRAVLAPGAEIAPVYARQIDILVSGSVEPRIAHSTAAKLGECFPVTFKTLVNTILELTGQGAEAPKKPPASTETEP